MPRYLAVCAALAAVAAAVPQVAGAQEVMVPSHPNPTHSPISAYRYEVQTPFSPQFGDNTPIPVGISRRLVCDLVESTQMSKMVEECTNLALAGSATISKEDVAVTMIELHQEMGGAPKFGHLHGNEMRYASGVARMFWGTALYRGLQERCVNVTPALERDVISMLRDDDTTASNKLIDYLTGTTSGDALGSRAFGRFLGKRDYANNFFCELGFLRFNMNEKFVVGPPEGRDLQLLGRKLPINYENSNRVTTNQAAALMYLISEEAIVSKCASRALKAYMFSPLEQRKVNTLAASVGLPVGSQVVSVNGYTKRNYNDVSKITLPNGKAYVLAVFSKYRNNPTTFIPILNRLIAKRMMTKTGDDDVNDYLNMPPLAAQ